MSEVSHGVFLGNLLECSLDVFIRICQLEVSVLVSSFLNLLNASSIGFNQGEYLIRL